MGNAKVVFVKTRINLVSYNFVRLANLKNGMIKLTRGIINRASIPKG